MPSLSELEKFKASFNDLGRQKANLAAKGVHFDDLTLPDSEPTPLVDSVPEETNPADDLDFSAFLGSQPEDLAEPPAADMAEADLYAPEDLLSNLSEELDAIPPDFPDEPPPMDSIAEEPLVADSTERPLDLDSLDNFDFPEEPITSADSGESSGLDNLGDFDLPADTAEPEVSDESPDLDSLGDFDLPADTAEPEVSGESPDLDSLGDFDLPADTAEPGSDESVFDESASTGIGHDVDLGDMDDIDFSDGAAPEGDDIDIGGDFSGVSSGTDQSGLDDFSFPDLDNMLKETPKEPKVSAPPKKASKGKPFGKAKKPPKKELSASKIDDVEEIQLSDDDFESLKDTLSRYPLNLRIACEEIIAEQVIAPKQMSELIEHLVWGASAKETAVIAGRILGRTITIPKAFEKSSGAALEAEQSSFAYIFVHKFLPILRLLAFIAIIAVSLFYLIFTFVIIPLNAESIYKKGYALIFEGEYQRANERFDEAFNKHRKKTWFYKYAEAFRDERQYIYAEQKYKDLLLYYPRDKKGVLDYANLETYYLHNYAKADELLREELLDYAPNDRDGLLAAGDNCLIWGEIEPARYEDARYYYARVMEKHGWTAPVVERMMMYFIRTDNLKEVLMLRNWFDNDPKAKLSAVSLGELGGYLLDKKLEEVQGVPNEYVDSIDRIRDLLLEAVFADTSLPEPHYHLSRYYQSLGNDYEERVSLRVAVRTFEEAPEGSVRRLKYRIDAHQRYADSLIKAREFIPAEEQLIKGINVYEDAITRRLITRSPQYGKLYAGLGDLEYFTKTDDMEAALRYYHRAEQNGWTSPEMQYRMGAAYYQLENWKNALEYLFNASSKLPLNRRVLFALGNASLKRGDYFAAQGYYNRLLDMLENQRGRLPILLPNDRPEYLELAERLMMARNNAGVANEMLAAQTGNRRYYSTALALYAEANRAWDARNRDPRSMIRSGSTPLPFLNSRNALYPQQGYEPQLFIRIDREALETSQWEELSPLLRQDHGMSN
jgi:tetratricopeptide (TPR) repeat protein